MRHLGSRRRLQWRIINSSLSVCRIEQERGGAVLCHRLRRGCVQGDAVHWTDWKTEGTASAVRSDDGMHTLCAANNCIHRAGLNTFRTANTHVFFDERAQWWIVVLPACAVIAFGRSAQKMGQCHRAAISSGRAMIAIGLAARHGVGIGSATRIAALAALCLGQKAVKTFDEIRLRKSGHEQPSMHESE